MANQHQANIQAPKPRKFEYFVVDNDRYLGHWLEGSILYITFEP